MYLRGKDIVSGQEGKATMLIAGRIEDLFMISNINATVTKQKAEVKTIGKRGTQRKANGWSGAGSMNVYYVSSIFRQMMLDYIKTGNDAYFDIQVVNNDPTSSVGAQEVTLVDCNIDSVVMAMLDVSADAMAEDIAFTFDDVDMPRTFNTPVLGN